MDLVFCYKGIGIIFAVVISTCLRSASAFIDDSCSSKVIGRKENDCFAHYNLTDAFLYGLPQPAELTFYSHNMNSLCRNIINITSCLEEVMLPCRDPYFDFSSYNNTLNKICRHRKLFMAAETHCEMIDTLQECIGQYNTDVQDLKYHIYLNRSEIPLSDMCIVLTNTRKCFHINETVDCKPELSRFLTSLYRGRFLPAVCTKKPVVTTNGSDRMNFSTSQFMFLFILLIWIKSLFCLYEYGSTKYFILYYLVEHL